MPAASASVDAAAERSDLVRTALGLASGAHAGQVRNASGGRPYIDHPVAVAAKLDGGPEELIAAALLHDVVEDTELGVDDVREACGERVAELVAVLTDDEGLEDYEERKREHRARVLDGGEQALEIYAADKLTNAEMLREAYGREGEGVAAELKVSLDVKVAVWEADLEMLSGREGEKRVSDLARRLGDELGALARDRAARARG